MPIRLQVKTTLWQTQNRWVKKSNRFGIVRKVRRWTRMTLLRGAKSVGTRPARVDQERKYKHCHGKLS